MATHNLTVAGRQFRVKTDYEAALRDKAIIDGIRSTTDFNDVEQIQKLYQDLNNGVYKFESLIGNDFDDEIYELVQKKKNGTLSSQLKQEQNTPTQQKKMKTPKNPRKEKKTKGVSLDDVDPLLKQQIFIELKKREKRRKITVVICSLMAVLCFGYFGLYYYYIGRTQGTYSKWSDLRAEAGNNEVIQEAQITLEDGSKAPPVLEKYKALYNKNKSLIGWIKIADTNIDYPVMQTVNNEYYLDHNLEQKYDKNGSIFMDKDCDVIKPSTNLIIYGHHMKSGQMFGGLDKYSKKSYFEEHPVIEFDTIYEEGKWQVMYVFRSRIYNADEIVFKYYQFIDAYSQEEFESYMEEMSAMSLYDTGVTASYGEELLTLSTCDYSSDEDGRFVVVAKRINN